MEVQVTLRWVGAWVVVILGGCAVLLDSAPLRVMTRDWSQSCRCSADANAALDRAVGPGTAPVNATLSRSAVDDYWSDLVANLESDSPPDVIWVRAHWFGALADGGRIVALDDAVASSPGLVAGLAPEALDQFRVDGKLYAIPLVTDGLLSAEGLAVTRSAMSRGKLPDATAWIGHARDNLGNPELPDLAARELRLRPEILEEGEDLVLSVRIENAGGARAGQVDVQFYLDGRPLDDGHRIDELDPGGSEVVALESIAPPAGAHVWAVLASQIGPLEEASQCNNDTASDTWIGKVSGQEAAPKALGSPVQLQKNAFQSRSQFDKFVRVASDGTDYLVVWKRQASSAKWWPKQRLVGARVSAAGKVIGTKGFHITQTTGWYDSFNVAFDGKQYVVVWEDVSGRAGTAGTYNVNPYGAIKAARVSKAGVVLDTNPIVVEAAPCGNCPAGWSVKRHQVPDIASTGTDSIVVYRSGIFGGTNYTEALFAKTLTQGGKIKPGKFKVVDLDSSMAPSGFLSLAFNSKRQEGLVLFDASDYTATPYQEKVIGVWLKRTAAGLQATTPKTFIKQDRSKWWLDDPAATAGPGGEYLGAYENNRNKLSSSPDIHGGIAGKYAVGSFLNKNGLAKGYRKLSPDVAYDGNNYLLVYTDVISCGQSYVGARRVTPLGKPGAAAVYMNTTRVEEVAVAFGKNNGLIAYTQEMTGKSNPSAYEFGVFFMLVDKS